MDKYEPKIGDVILHQGEPYVVVKLVSFENASSCTYSRRYLLCNESYIRNNESMAMNDLETNGVWLNISGMDFPVICKVDSAPYEIKTIEVLEFRKKTPKTITVYE